MNIIKMCALLQILKNDTVSYADIADALDVKRQYIAKIKDKELTEEQFEKIEKKFEIKIPREFSISHSSDSTVHEMIKIHYWDGLSGNCDKIKNPLITSLWFDREIVYDEWKKDAENLCIIAMPGEEMDGGEYPIRNGNVLLVDESLKDISNSGIYFYTTQNNQRVFVNRIKERFDGTVLFSFANSIYEDRIITREQLKQADFKVVGRVIKNLSLVL